MEVYTFSEHTDLNEEIYLLQKGIDIVKQLFDSMTYKSPVNYSMSFFSTVCDLDGNAMGRFRK